MTNTEHSPNTLLVRAYPSLTRDYYTGEVNGTDGAGSVRFASVWFETLAEAEWFASLFPKSAKMRAITCHASRFDAEGRYESHYVYYAQSDTGLASNGVNAGVNETGIKRYRSMMKTAAKVGLAVVWEADGPYSYKLQADFEAAVAAV